jgi:glycosyltransferase involved in cell wall biosynthesis
VREASISVVMPNLNGARYLRRALDSFLAEDYQAKELIVVDGRSTDDSHEVLAEYARKHANIRWMDVPDRGISDAINIALEVARGEIIGYLGSDDLLSGHVFRTIARWEPFIDFDAIFFNSYTYYVKERRCVLQKPSVAEITFEALLANGTIVGLQNTFYRRRVFDELRFNVENRYSMDYEMLLEVAQRKGMFLYVDDVATLNYFDGNISHNNHAQAMEAAYVARRFCGDYQGPLFGEEWLPESDRRAAQSPAPTETGAEAQGCAQDGEEGANAEPHASADVDQAAAAEAPDTDAGKLMEAPAAQGWKARLSSLGRSLSGPRRP